MRLTLSIKLSDSGLAFPTSAKLCKRSFCFFPLEKLHLSRGFVRNSSICKGFVRDLFGIFERVRVLLGDCRYFVVENLGCKGFVRCLLGFCFAFVTYL